ncbi:MAG: class I SAM-dependent methyltransferase [Elusimicrobia bacterium]|nr:class I SAM-dependent methyltransferase [Elusimicrobiota bacterium]
MPGLTRMLRLGDTERVKLLDLACGQGVLARSLPATVDYWGVDLSESLVAAARKHDPRPTRRYEVADACKPLPFEESGFSHVVCMLAIQNVENPAALVANAAARLAPGGRFVLVLNHPCFRIPKQTSWEVDERRWVRFRRVDRYLSRMRAAIVMNPGLGAASAETWSFHAPLSDIFTWFKDAGLLVEGLEEWVSNKRSEGPAAVMENRARAEFPLFLALAALKKP